MDDLSYLLPVPEPVLLGTETFQAVCFQLRDIARLQGFVKVISGDPLDGKREGLFQAHQAAGGDYLGSGEASRALAGRLRQGIRALEGWPPLMGTPGADRLLWGTEAGSVLWMTVLLARTNPGFEAQDARRVVAAMSLEQWLELQAIAYAELPADWLGRLMDPAPRRSGKKRCWGEVIERLACERGWTYPQIGELYLSQLTVIAAGGSYRPGELIKGRDDAGWYRAVLQRRRGLFQDNGHAEGL